MATLQSIRTKGPLLVIVIGLALFAFIAGDAWKVIQPHRSQDVGEINGKSISAQDFQKMVEEYTEVVKFSSGLTSLTDEQNDQLKDEVWRTYVNNKLIEAEAEKLGLTVSKAEIESIINEGTNPLLAQTPFRNPKTGIFDKDMLKKFLADYAKMDKTKMPAQYAEYYESMYKFWNFIEKTLVTTRLAEKYQALVSKALFSNPVEAQAMFDARVKQSDLMLAAVPYSSIPDATIKVSDSEIKDLYNKKKEQFKQYVETRDIKYIDVKVKASKEDRAAIQKEMDESTDKLRGEVADYTTFVRASASEVPYRDLFITSKSLPADVVSRLDSVAAGDVFGPYYSAEDNTLNSFKVLGKVAQSDSVQYRQIQVSAADATKSAALADSICKAIKGGANFVDVAKKYGQTGEANWMSSANYEKADLNADNLKYINTINNLAVNDVQNLTIGQASVVLQVLDKKAPVDKYKVAIIKRTVQFSKDTYNKAYNDFSQFIASNPTAKQLEANAENAGYQVQERPGMSSAEHTVAGIKGTKEALKWIFSAKKGDISSLYDCGESDQMLVVILTGINPEGYMSINQVQAQLKAEIIKDKKAEKIMAEMNGKTTINQIKTLPSAVSDIIKHVTFAAPAFVSVLNSSEPLVGAFASVAKVGQISKPIKGNAGVFVLQVTAKGQTAETYNKLSEEASAQSMSQRLASRFVNDLYIKAKVKDTRYLFF
jgi:peptidyl-prolyl cis-trans isomerase D